MHGVQSLKVNSLLEKPPHCFSEFWTSASKSQFHDSYHNSLLETSLTAFCFCFCAPSLSSGLAAKAWGTVEWWCFVLSELYQTYPHYCFLPPPPLVFTSFRGVSVKTQRKSVFRPHGFTSASHRSDPRLCILLPTPYSPIESLERNSRTSPQHAVSVRCPRSALFVDVYPLGERDQ
jgi:hypothetical protein